MLLLDVVSGRPICLGSLFERRQVSEPALLKLGDVSRVHGGGDGLKDQHWRAVRVTHRFTQALTSSSYRIAGTFLLIKTELGWILTCYMISSHPWTVLTKLPVVCRYVPSLCTTAVFMYSPLNKHLPTLSLSPPQLSAGSTPSLLTSSRS